MIGDPLSRADASTYAAFRDDRLHLLLDAHARPSAQQEHIHASFRTMVLSPEFVCVGAKSAIHRGTYRTGLYGEMGSLSATANLARDLTVFEGEYGDCAPLFTSFVASFEGPVLRDEERFEMLLWRQLQALHDLDWPHHDWDPAVSSDPQDSSFSFSFARRAYFVVALHPFSSRRSRRFGWPTLVFNRHDQFDRLRADGRFGALQRVIRARDQALQGELNPMVSDFGTDSEARQYSGRAVDKEWVCPFQPRDRASETGERNRT